MVNELVEVVGRVIWRQDSAIATGHWSIGVRNLHDWYTRGSKRIAMKSAIVQSGRRRCNTRDGNNKP